MSQTTLKSFVFLLLCFSLPAIAQEQVKATVTSHSDSDKEIKADVVFETTAKGLKVTAKVKGLDPNSKHGFHIHEHGLCNAPDYKSAGEHFNPEKVKHGGPHAEHSHLGDLGNINSNNRGEARVEMVLDQYGAADLKKIIGKSVLIHEKEDDYQTQPSGDSGARIACGVIRKGT